MKVKQAILSATASVVRKMTDVEYQVWPPVCIGLMYEPVRPKCETTEEENAASEQH